MFSQKNFTASYPILTALVVLLCAFEIFLFRRVDDVPDLIDQKIAKAATKTYHPSKSVIGPYTPAVQVGNSVYVSGQIGLNPQTTQLAGSDIETQTRQALTNLFSVLTEAKFDSSDVVQCTVYLKDMKEFQRMNLIYGGYFGEDNYPARTTVEVSNLPKDAKVEIAAIAVKSKTVFHDWHNER